MTFSRKVQRLAVAALVVVLAGICTLALLHFHSGPELSAKHCQVCQVHSAGTPVAQFALRVTLIEHPPVADALFSAESESGLDAHSPRAPPAV